MFIKIKEKVQAALRSVVQWWQKANEWTKRDGNPKSELKPPYTHCMNCGAELQGMFCHKCGQYASKPTMRMSDFIKEYIKNTLSIERQVLPTLSNLIFHPGHMPKEFCKGRYASYHHPLKLNLFFLLVLITIFALAETNRKLDNKFEGVTKQESFISGLALGAIRGEADYFAQCEAAPRDTLRMVVSYKVVKEYSDIVQVVSKISVTDTELPDTLIVSVPHNLIEDKVLIEKEDGYYFSYENNVVSETMLMEEILDVWNRLTGFIFSHFPLLMLLTAPFLAHIIRLVVYRRYRAPRAHYYIFALYYMAFVELLLMGLFLVGLAFDFSYQSVERMVQITLFLYLTVALKTAYDIPKWWRAAIGSAIINTIYIFSCVFVISMVSLVILIVSMV